ncbi:MAG: PDZ domain-containing protein [Pirellulaceae bacterium]
MNTRRFISVLSAAILVWGMLLIPGSRGQEVLDPKLDVPLVGPEPAVVAPAPGYLGMSVDLVAPEGNAVFVVAVAEGGPAQQGGLRPDDVILSINEVAIRSLDDMDRAVRQPAGTRLVFLVRRGPDTPRITVTLAERPGEAVDTEVVGDLAEPSADLWAPPPPAPRERAYSRPTLGISVVDVSDLMRRRFGVTVNYGAVITQVHEGSAAARAGLPLGGVIVAVNGKRIGSANDILTLIQAFRPGDEVELTYFEGDRLGRKKVRLVPGAATDVAPSTRPSEAATDRTDPPLRLGRRRTTEGRPILEALERTLDAVLPDGTAESGDEAAIAPPPPPARPDDEDELPPPPPPPAPPRPGQLSDGDDAKSVLMPTDTRTEDELIELRRQMDSLKTQLERLQRRIDELERRKGEDE